MKTVISLADRLREAERWLWEYVEQDECACEDEGHCLYCKAHAYLVDEVDEVKCPDCGESVLGTGPCPRDTV